MDIEVIAFEPGERWDERISGMMSGEMIVTFDAVDGGTSVHVFAKAEPGGLFGLATPLIKDNFQK